MTMGIMSDEAGFLVCILTLCDLAMGHAVTVRTRSGWVQMHCSWQLQSLSAAVYLALLQCLALNKQYCNVSDCLIQVMLACKDVCFAWCVLVSPH